MPLGISDRLSAGLELVLKELAAQRCGRRIHVALMTPRTLNSVIKDLYARGPVGTGAPLLLSSGGDVNLRPCQHGWSPLPDHQPLPEGLVFVQDILTHPLGLIDLRPDRPVVVTALTAIDSVLRNGAPWVSPRLKTAEWNF